jgi:hypothetical protein
MTTPKTVGAGLALGLGLLLATAMAASTGWAQASGPASVPDLGEVLLQMGPHEVGFAAVNTVDPATGRSLHLMIWFPTGDDIASKPIATYPQVVIPGVLTIPFTFSAADYAPFVEGKLVYEQVSVAPGLHPLLVHLPGGGAPGFLHIYEGVKFASYGFIFVSVTQPGGGPCAREQDAKFVLDELLNWNQTPANLFYFTVDSDSIFGGGFSAGGRFWLARTSMHQLCGLAAEDRIAGLAVKDANFLGLLTTDQMRLNFTPTFLNSQFCSQVQIETQQNLGSRPAALTLEGFTPTPSETNHNLFVQGCMHFLANKNAGNPIDPFVPPFVKTLCINPTYVAFENFFARQTTKYNIAYLNTLMGQGSYRTVLAPGRNTEPGVHVIQTATGAGGNNQPVGFCSQPGKKPGENPLFD